MPLISFYLLFFVSKIVSATDTITQSQSLTENQTLVSKNENFQFGFFTLPQNSSNRYLGIWYNKIPVQTVVWLANRERPVTTEIPAVLMINKTQNNNDTLILHQNYSVLWSITPSRRARNMVLQLLDSGNLVLREQNDENEENYLWQSFDYPCDTLLPGMKLGKDLRTEFDRRVTAWKNEYDPSIGNLSWGMDVTNWPQQMQRVGSMKQYNRGSWNGIDYTGRPTIRPSPVFEFKYFADEEQVYFMFSLVNSSVKARMVLNQSSYKLLHLAWDEAAREWNVYGLLPRDFCDDYGACGPNGNCDVSKLPYACDCLRGFRPKSSRDWKAMNYQGGCLRDKPLNCESDGFIKYGKMKVPDTENCWYLNQSKNLEECRDTCLRNCSCMAYTNSDIRGEGNGCALWFGDLNDLRVQPNAGQDLYVRVPASELDTNNGAKMKIGIAVGGTITILCGLLLALYFIFIRGRSATMKKSASVADHLKEEQEEDLELPLFDLSSIVSATDNFSINNKLGEGGFGPVYKGTLENGEEIAVKRLSRGSKQGVKEFKTEVALIAKLQHRNLVKLYGSCIQDQEKLLIYEYMPNKSLDLFIFDQTQRMLMDWSKRFHIICGIAKGLLYLHQDSRLIIIHRDLKTSNILLDSEMNPKISDFGLARILEVDQTSKTSRVVGTYGYMAPEYALDGNFSVKSDVYSFGILLLEIISGKKNKGNHRQKDGTNLIEYAWNFWTEGRPLELIDEYMIDYCNISEALRCIQIGLLCVQQNPHDRPNISFVVMMLGSEIQLPLPKEPALFVGKYSCQEYSSSCINDAPSVNELSISDLEALKTNTYRKLSMHEESLEEKQHHNIVNMQRMKNFHHFVPIIFHLFLYFLLSKTIAATDTLTQFQSLSENQTLVSKNGDFELGFFTLDNSTNINYYLGIWYKNIPVRTIVWVANREKPATNHNFVVLLINNTANSTILLTQKNKNTVLWSVSISRKPKNPILQLLDSGNLVLRDENDENEEKNYLWQSFDYPGDTLLPGMKVGKDLRTGFDWRVTAWKNENDPSPGTLNWVMDVTKWPEPMQRIGTVKQYNSGPWNGVQYSAKPTNKPSPAFEFIYFADENQVYYMFKLVNNSVKARMMLNQTTNKIMQLVWTQGVWKMYGSMPRDFCDEYGACGPNGKCDMAESPNDCECLRGYRPKSPKEWIGLNYEGGCLRDKPLNCESDGFIKYVKMKVPDTENCWYLNQSMNSVECRDKCLRNCSCMAYANSDIRGEGNGCALWFGDLNDLRVQPNAGQDLYVRVPASELETRNGSKVKIEIAVGSTIFVVLCSLLLVLYFTCIRGRSSKAKENAAIMDSFIEEQEGHLELPLFDLSSLAKATGNFSINNKVGEGGFGPVYKGLLKNGQEIAVKRLCRGSVQGLKEFKNEIALIVKLQHRNLVKLHGCCIHNEEKMLVYEYLPNKSLDLFIFDQTRRKLLDWSKCFHMIFGIAKGLLYLHRDSRLRIIHRDLKASNILLDSEMNPKISDFGMARILGGDQIAATTRRVVGTYGYMAPEYAIDGNFSVKSDVFSFGVLLLEILSGKKNKGNHWENESTDLIGYAWDLWTEERPLEIVDDILKESCNLSEVLRCIQISLLCLEQHPYDRPDMSSVIMMFGSEIPLPKPKQPALFVGEYPYQYDSANELSIEVLESR
ncbi:uncharacterized protein LOC107462330 [Arachis duranensis]|uniref:non-specific serine/threonine protein kinase n=1 Tax=Arachis duranensis TaxID=130453 RepID=A0A9C6TID5_ARADU|nr:uncharacterized protein LOC107462330 [Arachis duranensis]